MDEKRTIVLVDDHIVVRSGLKELIEKLGPYTVIGEYDSGAAFLDGVPLIPLPDLVIMDLNMPGMNGESVLSAFRNSGGIPFPVLVLTLNHEESVIIRLFRLGIRGFLRKDCSAMELKAALESILNSGYHYNEYLALSLHNDTYPVFISEQEQILKQMTMREREFLKYVCREEEYTYEQIADLMNVTARTVDGYRENLFDKFCIKSKTGLVLFVLKNKLIDLL